MKRLLILAVPVVLLLGAACEPDDDVTSAPAAAEADVSASDNGDPLYVTLTRDAYPDLYAGVTTGQMADVVLSMCDLFDSGGTAYDVAAIILDASGSDPAISEAMGFLVGAGVAEECPAYSDELAAL